MNHQQYQRRKESLRLDLRRELQRQRQEHPACRFYGRTADILDEMKLLEEIYQQRDKCHENWN